MELLVGAMQEARGFQRRDVALLREGDMRRGDAELVGHRFQAGGKAGFDRVRSSPLLTSRRGPVTGVNGTAHCSFG